MSNDKALHTEVVRAYLTPAEKKEWQQYAKDCGVGMSHLLRRCIITALTKDSTMRSNSQSS